MRGIGVRSFHVARDAVRSSEKLLHSPGATPWDLPSLARPLLLALIHPVSESKRSRKLVSTILHATLLEAFREPLRADPPPGPDTRCCGCAWICVVVDAESPATPPRIGLLLRRGSNRLRRLLERNVEAAHSSRRRTVAGASALPLSPGYSGHYSDSHSS